ncbi:GGDEF domain-containing protein [Shewanella eurypsychrophilus]|uniref:diguanylate cyclase n=1 Tax=Shewanella eurypsychrophilus TaxID=2593656 RepID=A0ABX6V450_9GAMM|nr:MULTISPECIES: diguanylate cyclase [Shewanella]QFU21855.1 diguanylate cyclase [Shewanella sp. YLB-09]QPG57144.1 GGDEF domain-containing protein [Shewanella eurypsychrophilus]
MIRKTFLLLFIFFSQIFFNQASAVASIDQSFLFNASPEQAPPSTHAGVTPWMATLEKADSISLTGGSYWLVMPTYMYDKETRWAVSVRNSIVESLDYWLIGDDGSRQHSHSGYYAPYEFLFDYGRQVELNIGVGYWLIVKMESRYFSSVPKVELTPLIEHKTNTDIEAMAVMLCLGGLIFIACYNLLIFFSIKDRAFLYYGLYVLAYFFGWALTFHIPSHLVGFHNLELHHLFFISLPIFNIMFYKHFLQLPEYSPKLWRLSQYLMWACIIALPTSIYLVSYTALIASVLIMLWIGLAITCGNVCLIKGFSPARYFIFAFTCLLLPAVIILPGNLGLTPDFIEYAELATLIGGTADALLLSLALANKIKLLSEERKTYIETLGMAWEKARHDELTQLQNRHAFDEYMQTVLLGQKAKRAEHLILIDIDGVTQINHTLGHQKGDSLLKLVANQLKSICEAHERARLFRIGGDNFVILLSTEQTQSFILQLDRLSHALENEGYRDTGISYGYAVNSEVKDASEWLRSADKNMYKVKTEKRRDKQARSVALTAETELLG